MRTRPNGALYMVLGVTVVPGRVDGSERGAYGVQGGNGGGGLMWFCVCCCGVWLKQWRSRTWLTGREKQWVEV